MQPTLTEKTRDTSDNLDLDLQIAEWFGTTVDQIDRIDLDLIEIIREYIWKKDIAEWGGR